MESNIQNLTQNQGKEIADLQYRVRALEEAAVRDEQSSYTGVVRGESAINTRDLFNLIIKVVTVVGSFGSIIYLLLQQAFK